MNDIKIGDHLYITRLNCNIDEVEVIDFKWYFTHWVCIATKPKCSILEKNIGKNVFKTREEAEEHIRIYKLIKTKRKKLKEYERKLNEELGLDTYILK